MNKISLSYISSWIIWPALLGSCIAVTSYGFAIGQPILFFNISYLFLAVTLLLLESFMPHEKSWRKPDGQTFANIAHTILTKGTVMTLVIFSTAIGFADLITPMQVDGYGIWPRHWPMAAQAVLGIVVAEFMLYWAHRIAHEVPFVWRFHAIHHSVTKLWVINTGRFHFIDSLFSLGLGMTILIVLGAPMEVFQWLSVMTAFIGILTHCNIEMRFGPISYIFNTPELHRWHHSRDLREGNKNYGENLII